MSLTSVKMSEEVWLTCLTHALSTETEEIMGLLLGDIECSDNGTSIALIWGASPQTRSDRRKDRVETKPEQLAAASAQAEIMTLTTGRTTRVIGWYHSHPHITVLPSHVDVRTQAMYQLLDSGFIGLIFSCFSEDASKVGRIQVIAFQSLDGKQKRMATSISVSPFNTNQIIQVESSLDSLGNVSRTSGYKRTENMEKDTGDSRVTKVKAVRKKRKKPSRRSEASKVQKSGTRTLELDDFIANADVNYLGRDNMGGSLANATSDTDSMDMTASMQEAMHRSNLEMSGAEYIRKEIPLQVLPTSSILKLESPLTSFTQLQHVLFEEERAAYNQALMENTRDGKIHPLVSIHHTSTYQASICKLMEYCLSPAINALQDRLRENEITLSTLTEEAKTLEIEAHRGSEPSTESPRNVSSQALRGSSIMGHRDLFSTADTNVPRRNRSKRQS
ncbi:hypothetical protein GIB67_025369 [Kingdonia uniflora]|uniref:MPN domain-containing protein n=1 Tax=Kingdonia uniflora TaxID=39325 RepID=A0A7J7NBR8_9MAGN|nr:hypothetical protein GIB67_025369 [Kingdonia uniflora]